MLGALALVLPGAVQAARPRPVAIAVAPPSPATGLPQDGDLNGDAYADLVVFDATAGQAVVFLGTAAGLNPVPHGTVRLFPDLPIKGARDVAIADADGDGHADIVMLSSRYLLLAHGFGDGSFAEANAIPIKRGVRVVMARLRGAGQPIDYLVLQRGDRIQMLINFGGGFGGLLPAPFRVGPKVRDLLAGDYGTSAADNTRDGQLDLFVLRDPPYQSTILYGDGDAGLSVADARYGTFDHPVAAVAFESNGDACADLAVLHRRQPASGAKGGGVSLLFGHCNGTGEGALLANVATDSGELEAPAIPAAMTALLLDTDARTDVAIGDRAQDRVVFLRSAGFTTFEAPVACDVGMRPERLGAGDFDGDGFDDTVVAGANAGAVKVLPGDGVGASCPTVTSLQLP